MYGYIYKTINIINNKIYVGQHKAEEFDPTYIGSGRLFERALKKYGRKNFICEILEWCENPDIADEKERYWVKIFNSTDREIGYNISKGGRKNSFEGLKHSKESKSKMSLSHIGKEFSEEWRENISKGKKGHIYSEERNNKISKTLSARYEGQTRVSPHKGFPLSDESKELMRQKKLGLKYSEETRKKMSLAHTGSKHKPHKKHNYPKNRKSSKQI
jgi:group I intron endonuclease